MEFLFAGTAKSPKPLWLIKSVFFICHDSSVGVTGDFQKNIFAVMMDTVNTIKLGVKSKTKAWGSLRLLSRESGIFFQSNSALGKLMMLCPGRHFYWTFKNCYTCGAKG